MSSRMYKLRLRYRGSVYKFLGFELCDRSDGSFIVIFNHIAEQTRKIWTTIPGAKIRTEAPSSAPFRITYRATGQINFHGVSARAAYWQPIYRFTNEFDISFVSIPSVDQLTKLEEVKPTDYIVGLPDDLSGRATFVLSMLPLDYTPRYSVLAMVHFAPFFQFSVAFGILPVEIPPELQKGFIRLMPTAGPRIQNVPTKHEAKIAFHQKRTGVSAGPVTSFQPNEGIYRIIFPVPMRVPPRVRIEFSDSTVEAEILAVTESEVRFMAKGSKRPRSEQQLVKDFVFDSEF